MFVIPLAIPIGQALVDAATVILGGAIIYNNSHDYPSIYDDTQKDIEYRANNREYHNRCDEPPPPNMKDPCEIAKWKLNRARDCLALRKAMTNKWFNGETDEEHAAQNAQREAEIARQEAAVAQHCKKCP